jgi:hypothetical protein
VQGLEAIHAHATQAIVEQEKVLHTNAFAKVEMELMNRWWWVYLDRACVAEGLRWPRWRWPVAVGRRIAAVGDY